MELERITADVRWAEDTAPARAGWACYVSAGMVGFAGVVALFSAISSRRGMAGVIPLAFRSHTRPPAIVAGLMLLFLARQLLRGQRRAWLAAVAGVSVSASFHFFHDTHHQQSLLSVVLGLVLLFGWQQFRTAADRPSLNLLLKATPVFAAVVGLYGGGALWVSRATVTPHPTWHKGSQAVVAGVFGQRGPLAYEGTFARFFPGSLFALGVAAVVFGSFLYFRPVVEGVMGHDGDGEARAADLVVRHGADTLAYFTLRSDKSWFFSADGSAFLAYRALNGLAVVSGDPVGPAPVCVDLLRSFVEHAHARSWKVTVLAGREDYASMYRAAGLRPYYLGDEALLDPYTFSLDGRPIRKVRQSMHRLQRAGYTAELVSVSEIDDDLRAELVNGFEQWRRGGGIEHGFTMATGRAADRRDQEARVLLARDPEGRVRAFLQLVPCYGDSPGWSLDIIRRDPTTPNGTVEFMICELTVLLKKEGCRRLSLNFAGFGRLLANGAEAHGLGEHVQKAIGRCFGPFFQVQSIRNFNAKFFPGWAPRCIWYEDASALPRIGLTYIHLEKLIPIPLGPAIRGPEDS